VYPNATTLPFSGGFIMKARDVMTKSVVTVRPETTVREIARRLIERNVSAVPVVDLEERVVGIVSEGDLMRRPESDTERYPSWWLHLFAGADEWAQQYVKSHGLTAADVMTCSVITASEETSLEDIATLLEKYRIKRVPIVRDGRLVGIVSRANLLHGLVAGTLRISPTPSDAQIKQALDKSLAEAGVRTDFLNVMISQGVIRIWGMIESEEEKRAAQIAAERIPGVKRVLIDADVFPTDRRLKFWE
jgi:CBS domain-containing protein